MSWLFIIQGHIHVDDSGNNIHIALLSLLQKQLTVEKEKIRFAFQQMHKGLEEDEQFWLAQLNELEIKPLERKEENVAQLSQEISMLSSLISEIEGNCQQPASEFLQV